MRRKLTFDPARDYYAVLGIETGATSEDVRQAYRRSVRQVHPDLHQDRADWATEQIQLVNEAYDVLSSPARRRQYDRLRWAYVPLHPAREKPHRSPFVEPDYDFDRPWWEQMRTPRGDPGDPIRMGGGREALFDQPQPFWLSLAAWMNGHGLARLETAWLTLVGLWRSPYAGVLTILALALGINVAAIIYVGRSPQRWAGVQEWLAMREDEPEIAVSSPTPDRLRLTCDDPGVQIKTPTWGDEVGDLFSIYGTVQHPEMWNYTITIGPLGEAVSVTTVPARWQTARQPPLNQSIPEPPIADALLTEQPVDLTGQPAGYYAIRLRVTLRNGQTLRPCDVIVRH
jgi:hypothetical protein